MEALLRRLTASALRRGLGGSRPWMAVALAALGVRVLRRLAHSRPEVRYRTVVRPGDAFEISARRPPA